MNNPIHSATCRYSGSGKAFPHFDTQNCACCDELWGIVMQANPTQEEMALIDPTGIDAWERRRREQMRREGLL